MTTEQQQQEQKEFFALAAWLQTFPEFELRIYNGNEGPGDAERLISVLESVEATQYVPTDYRILDYQLGGLTILFARKSV